MSYKFFTNKECEYYPCHNIEKMNCLFCFCPLYFLECEGDYKVLKNGLKDCSKCIMPHSENGYDYIIKKIKENSNKQKNSVT